MNMDLFKNRKVLITGHTGFKGTWLCRILSLMGADVAGYSLETPTTPSLFELTKESNRIDSTIGDIRDFDSLNRLFQRFKPEIAIHLAAQPIVRESYNNPVGTYNTNVMGTVNFLECVRINSSVKSVLNVTTDKVYENKEWFWGFRENETLNGYDPYSNSKSCSELVTHSYINSFFGDMDIRVSTARAGNVIGGGDFASDRIIPDCVRAALSHEKIFVRNPNSVRPYQHVLEPLYVYLIILAKQLEDSKFVGNYNVGPDECDCISTGELVDLFCTKWGGEQKWETKSVQGPHESNFLRLDCSKLKSTFEWKPSWNVSDAVEKTVEWYKCYSKNKNLIECMDRQINDFFMKKGNS